LENRLITIDLIYVYNLVQKHLDQFLLLFFSFFPQRELMVTFSAFGI